MKTYKVKDFLGKNIPSKKDIDMEYSVLEQLFETKDVLENLLLDDKGIYSERNRYSDILTYNKSRVKLIRGQVLSEVPESDYINACYVNSPFPGNDGLGDKKIIAS
jgi:protein tyrosine phosphatase